MQSKLFNPPADLLGYETKTLNHRSIYATRLTTADRRKDGN